ncbi:ribonuclease III [Candidatus Peregrinibacteria bacterium CG08_land_8_20_14_0_20_41_10]|nr:MAG: ribonuclease III [Candidatus Peregrinibacteria bacterium CG1_02_41_10]PIS32393.1 MAG: ribonuclease III [Candidatus Peregrinibacteria bacterium CG08_land_8_20_14_0_20_41_10]
MLSNLEKQVGFTFQKEGLYETAFTHRSHLNEHKKDQAENNERLEFLGDAILEFITTSFLYHKYPLEPEGHLTNLRAALVRKENLAKVARQLDLGSYLKLGRGEEGTGGREKDYLLANTLEALIGAVYLDQGLEKAQSVIQKFVLPQLEVIVKKKLYKDAKSEFQEIAQEKVSITPEYREISSSGPDHAKAFVMGAYLGDKLIAKGKGPSKRMAEEQAAEKALKKKLID